MAIVRILSWSIAAVAAGLTGMSSFVIANKVQNPQSAYALGIEPSGRAAANLAFATFAKRQRSDPRAMVNDGERRLALQAYRKEPLSSAALGLLIASGQGQADTRWREELLDLAGRLTRRSSMITSASISAAARQGDEDGFFRWMSRAIMTNTTLRTTYIAAMAEATARSGAEVPLSRIIGPQPVWADQYWRTVISKRDSVGNAAKLRVLVAQAPWRQTGISDTDRAFMLALVRYRQFDTARDLAAGLKQMSGSAAVGRERITNGSFERQPLLPPVDWQLEATGSLGASIPSGGNKLIVSAISGAHGAAARQLVELTPGQYVLGWDVASAAPIAKDALVANLACAERGGDDAQQVELAAGSHSRTVQVSTASCRWYWLSVNVRVGDMAPGFDAEIARISLIPVGQGSNNTPAPAAAELETDGGDSIR